MKKCAIIGSGNIGTDLLIKIKEKSALLEVAMLVGIDPESEGLARARDMGIATTHEGIEGLLASKDFADIEVVFDATSAKAHAHHAQVLGEKGKRLVDLTPAALGPFVVPVANFDEHLEAKNVNMVTCGGQATIPIVHAVSEVVPVEYAEIVASISSKSAGPGTRANIDEFTETTSRGIEKVGKAKRGKAIIVLNPAEPPLLMRDTVFCLTRRGKDAEIKASIEKAVKKVQAYVPGYRLVQAPIFEEVSIKMPDASPLECTKVTTLLEVKGAGDYLPEYAGNLDIMTSAAMAVGERMVEKT